MAIDAHQHFWTLGAHDCRWPGPDLAAIHRDYGPLDLAPLAAAAGVTGTVLVQSQDSDKDTDFILEVAARTDLVKAVVGWADMKASGAAERIAHLVARPKFRGLRPMLQNLAQDDWILDRALDPALEAMRTHGLSLDALVFARHLPHLLQFGRRHPWLPIVIDHGAKPPVAAGAFQPWADDIAAMAALPQIFCKLSGLVTEAARDWRAEDLAPYIAHLVRIFGPDRLMWGSDWPVLDLAGDYAGWHVLADTLAGLEGAAAEALFGGTARRFYRIA